MPEVWATSGGGAGCARPQAIDAEAHDRLMATASHLPHVLANVLARQAASALGSGSERPPEAGPSLRDMTRVAGANPRIWVDIFLDNAAELGASLAEHRRRVEDLERALGSGDAGWLARWIGEAAGNRRSLFEEAYRDAGALQRVRVHVPDRPGVLSGITQALGAEQINIEDFELHHMSRERGGTLTLLVGVPAYLLWDAGALTLPLARGFNVLTGETGAGKTVLAHALERLDHNGEPLAAYLYRDPVRLGDRIAHDEDPVHQPGAHQLAAGIDLFRPAAGNLTHRGDAALTDADICLEWLAACSVDHRAATND